MIPQEATYHFDGFTLDVANRRLLRGDTPVELSGRPFDALALLVSEGGNLVPKDRFFTEIWSDVVVTDGALTQCIKEIRRLLGDDAANPRYIQTVPRHGYRFIGALTADPGAPDAPSPPVVEPEDSAAPEIGGPWIRFLVQGLAGTLGGAAAGVIGGLLYGFALLPGGGPGGLSMLAVLLTLNVLVGATGAFGVSFGMAAPLLSARMHRVWSVVGAGFGGAVVGVLVELLGIDAFSILFGRSPSDLAGGWEGATLGVAVALGANLGNGLNGPSFRAPTIRAGLTGAAAGMVIPLAGGRLMGGSLDALARSFEGSRLDVGTLGRFLGEQEFGFTTQVFFGGLEGLFFGACVVGAAYLGAAAVRLNNLPWALRVRNRPPRPA